VSLLFAVLAVLAYVGAHETSVFAVRTIEVEGARPAIARRVETALRPLEGKSLLALRGDEVARLATALPSVAGISYDRAFPNTLRVRVETEQPVAVVRRGVEAWLVSRLGRVMVRIPQGTHRKLPRIWLRQRVSLAAGATLPAGAGADEVVMLDALRGTEFEKRIGSVHAVGGQWVYMVRGGLELRVGTRTELPLKLEVARRILARTPVFDYLDVSVPARPVGGNDPKLSD
jgi:hypothetical protein